MSRVGSLAAMAALAASITSVIAASGCNPLNGDKLYLWKTKEEDKASKPVAREASPRPSSSPSAAACKLPDVELPKNDPELLVIQARVATAESAGITRAQLRAQLIAYAKSLDLKPEGVRDFTETMLALSADESHRTKANEVTAFDKVREPTPAASASPAPSPSPNASPTPKPYFLHSSLIAFSVHQSAAVFARGKLGLTEAPLIREFADRFIRHRTAAARFVVFARLRALALAKPGLGAADGQAARKLADDIVFGSDDGAARGMALIDAFEREIDYGFPAEQAAKTAFEAVCYAPAGV